MTWASQTSRIPRHTCITVPPQRIHIEGNESGPQAVSDPDRLTGVVGHHQGHLIGAEMVGDGLDPSEVVANDQQHRRGRYRRH
ncbi:hypothetical protein [Mycolicibacterium mageritense]|uniref:hypothetical protein n=1 Tax=Mycolicibacterium mageritense TaxID=53462 RepID=UPI001E4472AB|nr:hypothetical protein [Mycolicibacterium mageritense]MCC9185363.1 hypothetical protein [Mycolicibacterium mageritense]